MCHVGRRLCAPVSCFRCSVVSVSLFALGVPFICGELKLETCIILTCSLVKYSSTFVCHVYNLFPFFLSCAFVPSPSETPSSTSTTTPPTNNRNFPPRTALNYGVLPPPPPTTNRRQPCRPCWERHLTERGNDAQRSTSCSPARPTALARLSCTGEGLASGRRKGAFFGPPNTKLVVRVCADACGEQRLRHEICCKVPARGGGRKGGGGRKPGGAQVGAPRGDAGGE